MMTRHESYMMFEVVEVDNGLLLRVSIPDRGNLEKLIVWQTPHVNEMESFAHFLNDLKDNFGPRSKNNEIFVAVGPNVTYQH